MPSDFSLQERFWRDVATAAGHASEDLNPRTIREAIEDMMRNYHLDEVPGFEAASDPDSPNVPDMNDFSRHSAFAPVFSRRASRALSWSCLNASSPILIGPRRSLHYQKSHSEPRNLNHFPGGLNPGIQADGDEPPSLPTPAANKPSPWYHWHPSQLPPWILNHYVWPFPTAQLAWTPHPQPSPSTSYPLSPWAAIFLTGGHPLPGTMPQWTPGTWPPLDWDRAAPVCLSPHIIPNPNNLHLPLIDWNVTKHPSTAKRLTPNHVVVDMDSLWASTATDTEARTLIVTCDIGHMSTLWGPIVIDQPDDGPVTLHDLFVAIYYYFQVPLTYPEVRYICDLHPGNYHRLTDAYHERCRESSGIPGWEAKQGFRRVDVLGDRKYWWGVWISSHRGTWWLSLGLVHPAHRGRHL